MKNTIIITVVLAIMLCAMNTSAALISQTERERIDSLLQKLDIPAYIRQDFSNKLTASYPEVEVSKGDVTTMCYVTKDSVRVGIIPMPAGQGMKQWDSAPFGGILWFSKYQLVSIDEGRAIGLRIIRDSSTGMIILLEAIMLFFALLAGSKFLE